MTFSLDQDPTPTEVSDAINYLLANFSQSVTADANTGQVIGPGGDITNYLYKYMFIKYADSFDGTVNFSNNPTNRQYYGLRNSDSSTESTNPSDYVWTQVAGGFGTTKFLYYLTTGGRSIQFQVSTSTPNPGWAIDPGTAIDLDIVTGSKGSPANFVVIRLTNVSTAPTDAEVLSAIGRLPIDGDLCTINYNSGISSIVYKYTTGWAVFQKYITGDLIVANSIVGNNIAANTIAASNMITGTITAASGIIADAAITNAKIASAAITTAKIGTAQVDTLQIAGQAVTVPSAVTGNIKTGVSMTMSVVSGQPIYIHGVSEGATTTAGSFYGSRVLNITINSSVIKSTSAVCNYDGFYFKTPLAVIEAVYTPSSTGNITVYLTTSDTVSNYENSACTLYAVQTKR